MSNHPHSFSALELAKLGPLWEQMRHHPFLLQTRAGTLPSGVFAGWMRQDYLFVEACIPFVAALLAKAPARHWTPLAGVVTALEKELQLFEERAAKVDLTLRGAPPSMTCHAYVQFVLATAYQRSYFEGFSVLYVAEKAYHEAWLVVREGMDRKSPWWPFVDNWSGEAFASYVTFLEGELNEMAAEASELERKRASELFRVTTLYEIAFWEMAFHGHAWPGVPFGQEGLPSGSGLMWNAAPDASPAPAWAHMSENPPGRGD